MLVGYTGTPRSGKTYSVIKDWYLETLKANINADEPVHIYTNINGVLDEECIFATAEYTGLAVSKIREYVHIVGNAWFLNIWEEVPPNSLVIADEAHKFWCSREWKSFPEAGRDFIAESGQYNVDIVWISQTAGSVEKWIVSRTEFINSALNLGLLGMPNRFVLRTRDGLSKYSNLKPTYHKIEPEIYNCYKSYQVEHKALKRKTASMFGMPLKIAFLVLSALLVYFVSQLFSDAPVVQDATASVPVELTPIPQKLSSVSSLVQPTQSEPQHDAYSSPTVDLWVAGIFWRKNNSVVLIEDSKGRQFKASRLGLDFLVNRKGKVLYMKENRVLKVGDSFKVSRELYSNLKLRPSKPSSNPVRVMKPFTVPDNSPVYQRLDRMDGVRSYHGKDGFRYYM